MQIHGELVFKDHVHALVLPSTHKSNATYLQIANQFAAMTGCHVVWMAESPAERAKRLAAEKVAAAEAAKKKVRSFGSVVCGHAAGDACGWILCP